LKPAMAGSTMDAMEPERSRMKAISVRRSFIAPSLSHRGWDRGGGREGN
jgi:hypothetical protein